MITFTYQCSQKTLKTLPDVFQAEIHDCNAASYEQSLDEMCAKLENIAQGVMKEKRRVWVEYCTDQLDVYARYGNRVRHIATYMAS